MKTRPLDILPENRSARLEALAQLGQAVAFSATIPDILQCVAAEARLLVGAEAVSVLFLEEPPALRLAACNASGIKPLEGACLPLQASLAGQVAQTRTPLLLAELSGQVSAYQAACLPGDSPPGSLVAAPLEFGAQIIGVIEAVHSRAGFFGRDELQLLRIIAQWAAIAIGNARQKEALQRRLQESQAITEISQALAGAVELEQVLQLIVQAASRVIPGVARAVIHLLDERRQALQAVAVIGLDEPGQPDFTTRPGEGIAGLVISRGTTINIPDIHADPRCLPIGSAAHLRSLMVAPVQLGNKKLGTLSVSSPAAGAFSADDERLVTVLGLQAALAIENAGLIQELEASLRQEKATRFQLVHTEKLTSMGKMIASVAHELNNPLQAIQNALYLVNLEDSLSAQAREDLRVALAETQRMTELITRLRAVYRPVTSGEFAPASLNTLVEETYRLIATHLRHNNIRYEFIPDPDLPRAPLIHDQIKQVILNLCLNAVEAMPDGGELALRTAYHPGAGEISLAVADNGYGIPPEVLPHIFEPFMTTKESGTGLGLAISFDIVHRHGGRIEARSQPGVSTVFTVWLPGEASAQAQALPPGGG
jgi:signal transduction histidine kinase